MSGQSDDQSELHALTSVGSSVSAQTVSGGQFGKNQVGDQATALLQLVRHERSHSSLKCNPRLSDSVYKYKTLDRRTSPIIRRRSLWVSVCVILTLDVLSVSAGKVGRRSLRNLCPWRVEKQSRERTAAAFISLGRNAP